MVAYVALKDAGLITISGAQRAELQDGRLRFLDANGEIVECFPGEDVLAWTTDSKEAATYLARFGTAPRRGLDPP